MFIGRQREKAPLKTALKDAQSYQTLLMTLVGERDCDKPFHMSLDLVVN